MGDGVISLLQPEQAANGRLCSNALGRKWVLVLLGNLNISSALLLVVSQNMVSDRGGMLSCERSIAWPTVSRLLWAASAFDGLRSLSTTAKTYRLAIVPSFTHFFTFWKSPRNQSRKFTSLLRRRLCWLLQCTRKTQQFKDCTIHAPIFSGAKDSMGQIPRISGGPDKVKIGDTRCPETASDRRIDRIGLLLVCTIGSTLLVIRILA
ncbi:uncharacterized protein BJX67DRAFT_316325 [Aspergillus lucknowensis]|uniref:Uncharacterized protein n=1 Tax=Aspergillus lucknowensis TaxID=176173 RepID=A0ABR4LC51_9EURO